METTIYIAKLFGLGYLAVGLGMLLNMSYYKKVLVSFMKEGPLSYVTGLMILILGLVALMAHNVWEGEWYVILVSVFICLMTLKGAIYLIVPEQLMKLGNYMMKLTPMWLISLISIGLGLLFSYIGFYL